MSAMLSENGNVSLLGLNPDKVDALIRCIEGASLPDKQLLQHELKSIRHPWTTSQMAKKMVNKAEVLLENTMEGIVLEDFQIKFHNGSYIDLDPSMQLKPAFNVKAGDKVKIKVIKM